MSDARLRPGLLCSALLVVSSVLPGRLPAASVAHEGFASPANVNTILMNAGHVPAALTAAQVAGGALAAASYDVFVIGSRTSYAGASAAYVRAVGNYVAAGGNIVTEFAGAGMFFSSYIRPVYINAAFTPQLGYFQGGVHAGFFHSFNTPVNVLDPSHLVMAGLANPYANGDGTEFFFWFDAIDPDLFVLGTFTGNGSPGFPAGQNLPCLATGCKGRSSFVFGSFDWGDNLTPFSGRSRLLLLNAINYASLGCNTAPVCIAGGPYTAECQGTFATISLDASQSSDPDGDALGFSWSSDCPGASFDDPFSPTPLLTLDTSVSCQGNCTVTVTVTDGRDASSSSAQVLVEDTVPPAVACAAAVDEENRVEVRFVGVDLCGAVQVEAVIDLGCRQIPVTSGQVLDLCSEFKCLVVDAASGLEREELRDGTLIVTATDACGNSSNCSASIARPEYCGTPFVRGDAGGNGSVCIRDALHILRSLHRRGVALTCQDAADANDDGAVDVKDAVFLVHFLFRGRQMIPLPFPQPGMDPTDDELTCEQVTDIETVPDRPDRKKECRRAFKKRH